MRTLHIRWARRVLRQRFGPNGEEYAEIGLAIAAENYDTGQGATFQQYARSVILRAAIAELRELNGRSGSGRLAFNGQFSSIMDQDGDGRTSREEEPMQTVLNAEQHLSCLRQIDDMPPPGRWIVLCRYMGDFSEADIERITGYAQRQLRHETAAIRQLVGHG